MTPFNLEAYKKNPERLRHLDGSIPVESCLTVNDSYLVVRWKARDASVCYDLSLENNLRLAPITRKVKCRLYFDTNGCLGGWTSDQNAVVEKFALGVYFKHWHGPEWEEEIPAGDV